VSFFSVVTLWCLNTLFWRCQDLKARERLARIFVGVLAGPLCLVLILDHEHEALNPSLHPELSAAGLLLSGVMELGRAMFRPARLLDR
jgi:hypothetical protein